MSTIEDRLARDIEAITRGVVVTDSDLRDARAAIDDQISSDHDTHQRRAVMSAAAAAVAVLVIGLAAYLSVDGKDKTAPPAAPGPSPSASVDHHASFLEGSPLTSEAIRGVWRLDNAGVLMRFAPPDLVSFDRQGRLFEDPNVRGKYAIEDDGITITVDGGSADCAQQRMSMRGAISGSDGTLRLVYTRPGTGYCNTAVDERWVMEKMLPWTPGKSGLGISGETGWRRLEVEARLYGTWLADGTPHLLELASNGSYNVAGGTGERVDSGQWSLDDDRITLTSGPDSSECTSGDRLVLSGVATVDPGTAMIRGTVQQNDCNAPWTPEGWILIPYEGS